MTTEDLVKLADWQRLSPRAQGYVFYMQAERRGSELKGEKNPWPVYSEQFKDFERGERQACLDAQDSED